MQKGLITVLMAILLVFGMVGGALAAWGTKELETEKIAVTFAKEVARGGYQILTTGSSAQCRKRARRPPPPTAGGRR